MTLFHRLQHRDPRELTLAAARYLLPIASVPSMLCLLTLILRLRYIIITLHPIIPQITRIYRPLLKIFSLNFLYLQLPNLMFPRLDVLLQFRLMITYIPLMSQLILFLINEIT